MNNAPGRAAGRLVDVPDPVLADTVASRLTAPSSPHPRPALPGLCPSERACVIDIASPAALPTPQTSGSTVFAGTWQSERPPDARWREVLRRYPG